MTRHGGMMTGDDVVEHLRHQVGLAGGIHAWAVAHGVLDQEVDAIYHGRRPPGGRVLRAMGLVGVRMYRPCPAPARQPGG